MRRGLRAGLIAAIPLLAIGAALAATLGREESTACELEEYPEQEGGHVAGLPTGFAYNSFPPSSGPSADRPLVWREYAEPVSQFRLVHNLLHGGLAVQYGNGVSQGTLAEIGAWYRADPDGIVVAPLPGLGDRVALTAWRNVATCGDFRERSFTAFRDRHRFNGPERPPRETMRPGRGGAPNPLGLRVTPSPVRSRATLSFLFAESATIEVAIRSGSAEGPPVRRLAMVSTLPNVPVRLTWDRRDDLGRLVAPGTYAAVATLVSGGRPATSVSLFRVE